jgi:sulfur relay (sulfurtransferase) complex TusBCD TusD component (DsrE family)
MEDPAAVTEAFKTAGELIEDGHEVEVFLTDNAVPLARLNAARDAADSSHDAAYGAASREIAGLLEYVVSRKVRFYVCISCARKRKIVASDMVETAQFIDADQLLSIVEKSEVHTF